MDERAQRDVLRRGGGPDRVHMNCSGKHAAMLACCVSAGWPAAGYLDPAHPVQAAIRRTLEELSGEQVQTVAVDGCGAPLFALSLTGVARALRALVTAPAGHRSAGWPTRCAPIRTGRPGAGARNGR